MFKNGYSKVSARESTCVGLNHAIRHASNMARDQTAKRNASKEIVFLMVRRNGQTIRTDAWVPEAK